MAIYKGLNVSLYLGDVENLTQALANLGLEINDLDRIRGLGTSITRSELHLLSGLDIDQEKENYALFRSANILTNEMLAIEDITRPLNFNIRVNNQLRAGAIKYNFLEYGDPAVAPYVSTKSADISTSRVSSWSKIGAGPIFYGADLQINPSRTGGGYGDDNKSVIKIKDLVIQGEISPKRFAAEETTDLVTININGINKEFYAMRSIPTSFEGFFRRAVLRYEVVAGISTANPTIVFADLSTDPVIEIPIQGANSADVITFDVTRSTDRRIDFYYRPDGIELFDLQNIKMLEFPNAIFKNLRSINLAFNDISELPDFYTISGSSIAGNVGQLQSVTMTGNSLERSPDSANVQLQKLPSSVKNLYIQGCFSDSNLIDIGTLPSKDGNVSANVPSELQQFYFDSYYNSYSARQMTDNNVSPEVNENSIVVYSVRRQPYRTLAHSITQSSTLQTVDLYNCNLSSAATVRGSRTGATSDITLASNVVSSIQMGYNSANIINVSGKSSLNSYYHYTNYGGASNNINGYFNGCNSLATLHLYHSYCKGDLNVAFANLPALKSLHLYNTRLGGNMHPTTFAGTTSLEYADISHGVYNTTADNSSNFFGNAVIDELNEVPTELGAQYGNGFYAGKMENESNAFPYSDAYSRPTNEQYYLVVADKQYERVMTQSNAVSYCSSLVADGESDWDLPTEFELELMYRNLKPDTSGNNTNSGNNPHSVPQFNRNYTSNSPGRTPLSIYQSSGSQAFTIPSNQNYVSGTSGWESYNNAGITAGSFSRLLVEQFTPNSNAGASKQFTVPAGTYTVSVRIRDAYGNGFGDDVQVKVGTSPGSSSRVSGTLLNADANAPETILLTFYTESTTSTLYLSVESESLDFEIENWSIQNEGAVYWSKDTGVGQNMQTGEQRVAQLVHYVRPVRRVPVKTGVQIEQQGTSNTFQPVAANMKYFYLRYNRGIRGKLPNMGFLNNLRNIYVIQTGMKGTIPDFTFARSMYAMYMYDNQFEGQFSLTNSNVSRVRAYRNKLTSVGTIDCPRMWDFHLGDNQLTGDFPNLSSCSYLHDIYLNNNNFTNYVQESLSTNTYLRKLYLYGNANLKLADLFRILVDLKASYDARPRGNVQANMTGIPAFSEQVLVTYPEFFGIYEFLRSKGWIIQINP